MVCKKNTIWKNIDPFSIQSSVVVKWETHYYQRYK
mgnify:CR=1 FL=1